MPPNTFEVTVSSNISQGIGRLYKDGQLCDLAVQVETSTFSCHSVVLASVSEYFLDVLRGGESFGHHRIPFKEVSADAFSKTLDILYQGKDLVNDAMTAMEVLQISVHLKINFLQEHCEIFLKDGLTPTNSLEIWQFAYKYDLVLLEETARKTACSNFNEISKSQNFFQLPRQFFYSMMSSEDLKVANEDILCKALFDWVNYDIAERKCHLPEFLPYICFPSITENYINELRQVSLHSNMELLEYLEDATTVLLETAIRLNSKTKTEILARYDRVLAGSGMEKRVIALGGLNDSNESTTDTVSFDPDMSLTENTARQLKHLPKACGIDFATCVWRNEVYVSGGSKEPVFFAMYNSGINEWKILPNLPSGREKHAMVGVNFNIYVLGGLQNESEGEAKATADILSYDMMTKTWNKKASLIEALSDLSAVVLGHRVYVVGGRDVDHNATRRVQCFDTLTGCVYLAGDLPSPTYAALSLNAGGTIYIIDSEGDVLQMKENCQLADESERNLAKVENLKPEQNQQPLLSTVRVLHVAKIAKHRHINAYIWNGDVIVCGGQKEDGAFSQDILKVETTSGKITEMAGKLPATSSCQRMHLLSVPKIETCASFRYTLRPDSMPGTDNVNSHDVILQNSIWCLQCRKQELDGTMYLSTYLYSKTADRNTSVTASHTTWIIPVKPEAKKVSFSIGVSGHEFCESESTWGWPKFISMEELTNVDNGYIRNGEVTLETTITILPNHTDDEKI